MLDAATGGTRNCEACPAGYKCDTTGMTIPTPCGKGNWSAASATTCTQCPVGHFCEREDTTETEKTSNTCSAGYLCALGTNERPYNDHEGQDSTLSDKYSCQPGNYCISGVATACAAGTY